MYLLTVCTLYVTDVLSNISFQTSGDMAKVVCVCVCVCAPVCVACRICMYLLTVCTLYVTFIAQVASH